MSDDDLRARQLAERIERSGFSDIELAQRSGTAKETVKKARDGHKVIARVYRELEQALEDIERDLHGPETGAANEKVITFTVTGHFGIKATVAGPVENLAELQAAVRDLITDLKAEAADG